MKKRELKQTGHVLSGKAQKKEDDAWRIFIKKENLSDEQAAQFRQYKDLLVSHNEQYNLTALTDTLAILRHHFSDSLVLRDVYDMDGVTGLVDVGTGAGFPALPLKILYPHLPMVLIEPTKKRQRFLEEVIHVLGMEDIEIYPNDWRTFIRTTEGNLNLFVSRAAIPVAELARMFKPSCSYNTGELIYWASEQWEVDKKTAPLVTADHPYKVGSRKRRLIVLKKS